MTLEPDFALKQDKPTVGSSCRNVTRATQDCLPAKGPCQELTEACVLTTHLQEMRATRDSMRE